MRPPVSHISPIVLVAVMSALLAGCSQGGDQAQTAIAPAQAQESGLAVIPPGQLQYYPPGEYLKGGYPVSPPETQALFDHELHIMKRQVSQAEFSQCVDDKACKRLDKAQRNAVSPDLPAVGVSWRDATDYAAWLSRKTGQSYLLPTFEEWVYAAGPDYQEDIVLEAFDPADPAQRWLAEYKLETQRSTVIDATPQSFGRFGQN